MNIETLDELSIKYETDKSSKFHNYCTEYDFFLNRFRDKKINLLEIGVGSGGSIKMWLDYFRHPDTEIIGLDLNENPNIINSRYKHIMGNQIDTSIFNDLNGFDIIIDDGSHFGEHQVITFEMLFNKVKSGGLYIVEDVATSYWPHLFGNINFVTYSQQYIDDVNYNGVMNEIPTEIYSFNNWTARSSTFLEQTFKNKDLKRKIDVKSIYYGNGFIIFFKK